jgi:outer membrane protein assembly factor BamB
MMKIKEIENVTYNLIKTNSNFSFVGINNEIKLLNNDNQIKDLPIIIRENQLKKIEESHLFFQVDNIIYKLIFSDLSISTFYTTTANKDIWIFNEDYIFEAERTENRREYKFDFLSLEENKIFWSDVSTIRFFSKSNKLLFTDFLGNIYKYRNIYTGHEVWSLDFSENKANRSVFLINDILIFETTNQDLIGVEIETGKELWRLANCNLHHQQQPSTNYLVGLAANSAGDNFYQVIDPIRGTKIVDKKFENFFFETTPNLACITETHYYFISNVLGDGGQKDERITHLGCINLQTHEIEWIEKVGTTSDRRSSYQKPEINGNKIYLLDGEKTLNIYELEK